MEHASLHDALLRLRDAGVHVDEIVTDQNSQVMGDFSKVFHSFSSCSHLSRDLVYAGKVAAAVTATTSSRPDGPRAKKTLDDFVAAVSSKLRPVDANDARSVLRFYSDIHHSVDIWHKAKNLRKYITKVSQAE